MPLQYKDYVKPEVDQELQETQNKKSNIPESVLKRFDGKSTEEVLEAYANLEQKLSSQGNDMGRLRKQVDQLIELQLQSTVQPSEQDTDDPVEPVTIDSLYEDTEGSITKVVKKNTKESQDRINQLEQQVVTLARKEQLEKLNSKYNNWMDDLRTEEFADWAKSSAYRLRLIQAADQYDFDAANDLLEMWYDHKNQKQEVEQKAEREQKLKEATLESSSPPGVMVPETYSRSELMEKRIRAAQGNREAQRWLQAHADAIAIAYEEGRISD